MRVTWPPGWYWDGEPMPSEVEEQALPDPLRADAECVQS